MICMLLRIEIEDEPLPTLKRKVVVNKKNNKIGGSIWGFKGDITPIGHGNGEIEEPILILNYQNFENTIKRYLRTSITKAQNSHKEVAN